MKPLLLVCGFWAAGSAIVGWALGLAYALDSELWWLAGILMAVPILALSTFMWFVFRAMLDDF